MMYTGVQLYGCLEERDYALAGTATGCLSQNITCTGMTRTPGRLCQSACAAWPATGLPPCSLRALARRPCKPLSPFALLWPYARSILLILWSCLYSR